MRAAWHRQAHCWGRMHARARGLHHLLVSLINIIYINFVGSVFQMNCENDLFMEVKSFPLARVLV